MSTKTRPKVLLVNRCIIRNKVGRVLVIQRADLDHWSPNKWEFPGGKLDIGQDTTMALEREVLEEVGIYVKLAEPLFFVETYNLTTGKYKGLPYIVITGVAKKVGGKISLSKEHQAYKWAVPKEVLKLSLTSETKKALISFEKHKIVS